MKKILIGCGVLLLLLAGGVGYLLYHLWEPTKALYETMEHSVLALEELNERFPYVAETVVEFDAERFETALGMRANLRVDFRQLATTMKDVDEAGVLPIEAITAGLEAIQQTFESVVDELAGAQMSPSEFSHHMLCYWAAAASASAGGGNAAELAPLIEEYRSFRRLYAEAREENEELLPLEERLSEVPETLVAGVRDWLARSATFEPVEEGDLVVELILLQLSDPATGLTVVRETADGSKKFIIEDQ